MFYMVFNGNNDCFVHFITGNFSSTCFSQISFHDRFSFLTIRLLCSFFFLRNDGLDPCDVLSYLFDPCRVV